MTSQRVWTTDSIQAWRKERDDVRTKEGLPAMAALTVDAKADALKLEKKTLVEAEFSILTSNAWPLDKYPNNAYPAPFSGYLLLPRGYRTNQKNDKIQFYVGDDLNSLTYGHYIQTMYADPKTTPGPNYISKDSLKPARHEYSGPGPCVAGYRFSHNQAEILWWDSFLQKPWFGTKLWEVEAEFDDAVEGWFLK